ncbi:glycosyltransferase [Paracoccus tegillarcae]|nr:glycosyltransferase [Paracoccus tegillarcae]
MSTALHLTSDAILPSLDLPAKNWDVVLTCFEPLIAVTGGIGTYHRLLLQELAQSGKKVLVLTRGMNAEQDFLPEIEKINVDLLKPAKAFNFVGLEHEFFSLQCHFALRALYQTGHRFGLVEFSDYGADGFYPLRARAAGIYEFGVGAVRLHSPSVMLTEDNGGNHFSLNDFNRDRIDREMSVYQDADAILFGGDAMRDRVLELTERFGLDVADKMVKCPHPYPRHLFTAIEGVSDDAMGDARTTLINKVCEKSRFVKPADLQTARFIGVFGRIEDRKGQFQMFWQAVTDADFVRFVKTSDFHFLVAGHNVLDHIGNYRLNDLYALIHEKGLQGRIHFTGRLEQDELAECSRAVSGYIFPSIFENYPNALLEILPTCRPVAISVHGCMPEITEGFSDVALIDPKELETESLIAFMQGIPVEVGPPAEDELAKRIATFEHRQAEMMAYYKQDFPTPDVDANVDLPSLGIVLPVYQEHRYLHQAISTAKTVLGGGENIVVVDDHSAPENARKIARITNELDVQLITLPENAGPAVARLHGVKALTTDLVQLCDGDDLLDPQGIAAIHLMFARDPDLTMATGVMSCFQEENHCWTPRNGNIWTATAANFGHSGSMFRRDALLAALGTQHERLPLNEDWLMNLLILVKGGKCRMTPEITYHYRRYGGSRSTQNASLVGRVSRQINRIISDEMSFQNPEQKARLREIYKGYLGSVSRPGAPGSHMSAHSFPLRYQYLDAVFFKLVKIKGIEPLFLKLKRRLVQRSRVKT